MAVEVKIDGNGTYAGISSNIADYSSVEDATPLDPASSNGGVGQFTFNVIENPTARGTLSLLDDTVTLSDGAKGTTTGIVSGIDATEGTATVTADSRLSVLLSTRSAAPQNMTMEQTFRYYLGLANVTTGIVFEQPGDGFSYRYTTSQRIPTPGWTGPIFDYLRQFAIVCGAEVSLVSNNVVFRPVRKRIAETRRNSTVSYTARKGQLARNVEVAYYQNEYKVDGQMYPEKGVWTEDTPVYQVDTGETLEVNVQVSASLSSVRQPQCVDYVGRYVMGSVYSVVGQDGLAIPTRQWLDNGGSVTVAIGEDPTTIDLKIVGANTTQGPYRIAVGAGPSDVYSSLRIQGTGTYFRREILTLPTGVPNEATPQEVGVTVENTYISTISDAYDLGVRTAGKFAGYEQSVSVSTHGINRPGADDSARYPTFDEFTTGLNGKTTAWANKTFNEFSTAWSGRTFDEFNATYFALVRTDFDNQAFGNVSGARVRLRDSFYRIDSASLSPTLVNYTATADTTFADFSAVWQLALYEGTSGGPKAPKTSAYTLNDFATIQSGRAFNDFNVSPLWRTYAGLSTAEH